MEASQKCFESTKPLERITNLPKPKDFPKGHLFFKYERLLNFLRSKQNKRNPLKNRKMESREKWWQNDSILIIYKNIFIPFIPLPCLLNIESKAARNMNILQRKNWLNVSQYHKLKHYLFDKWKSVSGIYAYKILI